MAVCHDRRHVRSPQLDDIARGIRPDTTREALARLQPAFKKDGVLTAGNSSQISDGASATVLMSERKAREIRRGTARYDQRLLLPGREA
ncbi:MAG: hypothetical protein E6K03_02330 [Methanobacteriota archaeon]|nr:MAG: hypothetical protein E6K03_02330 [Euryarchaeota archaeon]